MVEEVRRGNNKGHRPPYRNKQKPQQQQRPQQQHRTRPQQSGSTCTRCNRVHGDSGACPAYGKQCNECKRYNHFAVCCRSKNAKKQEVREVVYQDENEQSFFLGSITACVDNGDPWTVTLSIALTPVTLKVDSGAYISVISETTYNNHQERPKLTPDSAPQLNTSQENY